MPRPLSTEEVRHVAMLARLRLEPERVETLRHELSRVLDHIAMLSRVDVSGVEALAHPRAPVNRMDDDVVRERLSVDQVLANAPRAEPPYLAVPKVLDEAGGG